MALERMARVMLMVWRARIDRAVIRLGGCNPPIAQGVRPCSIAVSLLRLAITKPCATAIEAGHGEEGADDLPADTTDATIQTWSDVE